LARPENDGTGWVFAGRFFSLMGGFLGVLIGLVLMQSTKTLPDGRKVYTYDEETRKQGKTILYISLIVTAIVLTIILTKSYLIVTEKWFEWEI
jgi:hypothetical protein